MAATDQTYRNLKATHVVFGASCVLMLASTFWMCWQDYNREYKPIQRTFRDVEEGRNLRVMLEQLPRGDDLQFKITAAEAARLNHEKNQGIIRDIERQLSAQREKKDTAYRTIKAFYDSVASYYDMAVDDASKAPTHLKDAHNKEVERRRKDLDKLRDDLAKAKSELDAADLEFKEKVTDKLADTRKTMEDAEDDLKRTTGAFDRFAKATAQKGWRIGDTFRTLPIVDGFESPTKIKQIVLPDLTIDYSFKLVPRFDRCTTCHLGIDRAMFDKGSLASLRHVPGELESSLRKARNLLLDRQKKGEDLGFDPKDLPTRLDKVDLTDSDITQYAAHPRLDLFVDSNSPHGMEKFGCTICHNGQGSATSFIFASHTPADNRQMVEWKKNHDWYNIHDWDYPMHSTRFVESSCLQCHHQVTDLIRYGSKEEAPKVLQGYNLIRENGCFGCHEISGIKSGRPVGPDLRLEPTPALELLTAAEQERARSDPLNPPGALRKVGPSLRRVAEKTNEEWTRKWIQAPRGFREDTKMPHFYGLSNNKLDVLPDDQKKFPDAEIHSITHYIFAESKAHLKNEDTGRKYLIEAIEELQGKYGTATEGRALTEKEYKELAEATRNFTNLALLSHGSKASEINATYAELKVLQDRVQELKRTQDELRQKAKPGAKPEALSEADAKDLAITLPKLKATTTRLIDLAKMQSLDKEIVDAEGKPVAEDVIMKGDEAKGKTLFTEKGCLACHSHNESPVQSDANFAPNLSRLAAKLGTDGGGDKSKRQWLVQWLLNPNLHHPRTRMPITFLKPQDASDIASWLLAQEVKDYSDKDPIAPSNETLVEMARLNLSRSPGFTMADVNKFLPKSKQADDLPPGIDAKRKEFLPRDADEQALITDGKPLARDKLLWYNGRKSITRLGCFGCHDMPAFEQSKPIGTALNEWGKKDPERLAFEDAGAFVEEHFNIVDNRDDAKNPSRPDPRWKPKVEEKHGHKVTLEPYEKFFAAGVEHEHKSRIGFLSLKLAEPRSYDFNRLRNYDDRLRMPQFQFSRPRRHKGESDEDYDIRKTFEEAKAREAVMTFVLGLTAEPIPAKYIATPPPDRNAVVKGRHVLEKFNCAGCHQVSPGYYDFKPSKEALSYLEKSFNLTAGNTDSDKSLPALKGDHQFPNSNAWVGALSPYPDRMMAFGVTPKAEEVDREDNPDVKDKVLRIRLTDALRFTNNEKILRDIPAASSAIISERDLLSRWDPWGGALVHLLVGTQNEDGEWQGYLTKQGPFKGKPDDATSTLPPPLIREGERVQPKWLYQFLLNPTPIRPETHMKLRMPRFNMSPEDSQAIVNYFAATSKTGNPGIGLTYPYETIPERDKAYWAMRSQQYLKENDNDKRIEAHANAEVKDQEALLVDLKKADKKDDKQIAAAEERLKKLKEEIEKKNFSEMRKQWLTPEAYEKDAYKLLTNRNICLKCHSIGDIKIEGPVGPPLDLTVDRLRPEWTLEWISHPKRLFPYNTQMPQNFPNDQRDENGISKQWLDSFYGSPAEQARAVRDALFELPRLSEMNRKPAGEK